MTFLPIVDRELRSTARQPGFYRNRTLAAGAAALSTIGVIEFGSRYASPSSAGRALFAIVSWIALVFCLLEGVRKTADCVSEERREGTLGLLFLTDLKGYDVVLGKLAGASLNSLYGLIATLPVLAYAFILGGVTLGEAARMALALTNILFFSLSAGMFVSARSRVEARAVTATLWITALFACAPWLPIPGRLAMLSPVEGFRTAFDAAYNLSPRSYWSSLLMAQALSWLLLALASLKVAKFTEHEPKAGPGSQIGSWRTGGRRRPPSREVLNLNPALWLALRNQTHRLFLPAAALLTAVAVLLRLALPGSYPLPMLMLSLFAVKFMVGARLGVEACHGFGELRRNNLLESLLCTPLTIEEIVRGQLAALGRLVLVPALLIIALETGLWILAPEPWWQELPFFMGPAGLQVVFLLELLAVSWVGLWLGLASKQESLARVKTIFYVLILPLFASCLAAPLLVVIALIWISWARERLHHEFRGQAANSFSPPARPGAWLPFELGEEEPPSAPAPVMEAGPT